MIRELYRKGVSISEIARQTGHDRKTIRKIVNGPLIPKKKERKQRERKIDPYTDHLEKRISEGVLNARKLYHEVKHLGYQGKETMIRSFVQFHRKKYQPKATIRFETEPGEQAQIDWGHFGHIQHQGRRRNLYGFVMTLGWSRAMYLAFTVSASSAWFLRCHLHAFHYLGGVPRTILHDNLKTAVISQNAQGQISWNSRYLDFAEYYGFTPRACKPYRAQTKGKVESSIKYVKGNFWLGLSFIDLADLNHQALGWLNTVANVRVHGTTQKIPMEQLSLEGLQSLYGKPDYDTSIVVVRRSSRDCLVSYDGNFYSVPALYAQERLTVKETETAQIDIYDPQGEKIASHQKAEGRQQRVVVPAHYQGVFGFCKPPTAVGGKQVDQQTSLQSFPIPDAPLVVARPLSEYQQLLEVSA